MVHASIRRGDGVMAFYFIFTNLSYVRRECNCYVSAWDSGIFNVSFHTRLPSNIIPIPGKSTRALPGIAILKTLVCPEQESNPKPSRHQMNPLTTRPQHW